jgi:lantibiotic modifying enzyme
MLQRGGLTNLSKLRSELEVAIQATVEYGVGRNHSLCHGDLGNLELLLEASRFLDTLPCPDHLQNLTGRVLDDIQQHGWKCAQPQRLEIPGLMTGLAGIGYGLLRLAAPERTPSVLTLQ